MAHFQYTTQGTCSKLIDFDIDDNGCVHNVTFLGGCSGNLQGIGLLTEGKPASEIVSTLSGVRCGMKRTSCPDQLATALRQALADLKKN